MAVVVTACKPEVDPLVIELAGTDQINGTLTLAEFSEAPQVLPDVFDLLLTNESRETFTMPAGFAPIILASTDNGWVQLDNRMAYGAEPGGAYALAGTTARLGENEDIFPIWPDLRQLPEVAMLRVIVTGQRPDGERVAAYVDIPRR